MVCPLFCKTMPIIKMDPFQSKKKKNAPKFDNFVEAFKNSGTAVKPAKSSPDTFNFEEFLNQQESRIRRQEQVRFEAVKREEQVIFSREKQQEKLEIETLQLEIKKLAKEVGEVMVEAEKTS